MTENFTNNDDIIRTASALFLYDHRNKKLQIEGDEEAVNRAIAVATLQTFDKLEKDGQEVFNKLVERALHRNLQIRASYVIGSEDPTAVNLSSDGALSQADTRRDVVSLGILLNATGTYITLFRNQFPPTEL